MNLVLCRFPLLHPLNHNFLDVDNFFLPSLLHPRFELDMTFLRNAVIELDGFQEHEVKITPENKQHIVVTARREDHLGNFQGIRRTVDVPENVEFDKITSQFE